MMRSLAIICFLFAAIISNAQVGEKKKNASDSSYEQTVSRKQFEEARTIRDLVKGIPADCKLGAIHLACVGTDDQIRTAIINPAEDFQKQIPGKRIKSMYVTIKASCRELEYKVIIKDAKPD